MIFRKVGDSRRYSFVNAKCIGRPCWAPGMYQHRSPLSCGGSRNTGSADTACCLNRAYRGCPEGPDGERYEKCVHCAGEDILITALSGSERGGNLACPWCHGHGAYTIVGLPAFDPEKAKERKAAGWRASL